MVGKESSHRYYQFLKNNNQIIIVFLIFIIGIILRLLFIGSREIAYDDAFSYFLARGSLQDIITGTAADTMPPLYYFLLHFWMKISENLWFLRLLNILLNLITAVLVFTLSKELFNSSSAKIATFLFLISPFQIYHSQELRMYALLLLGQVGYFYSFLKIFRSQEKNNFFWIVAGVFFGLVAMYSHNLGVISLISVNVILLFKRDREILKNLFLVQFFILLFSIPWLLYLPQQIEKVQQAFWTQSPGFIDVIQALLTLFAFLPMSTFFTGVVLVIIIQSFVLLSVFILKNKSRKCVMIALLLVFPPTILFILSYIVKPIFVPRIFILSSVWFFILFSEFIEKNIRNYSGKINLGLFVIVSLISLPFYYQFNTFPRSSFRELANSLEIFSPEVTVIHDNKLSFFPTMFYDERVNTFYLKDPIGSPNDTLAFDSQLAMGYVASENIEPYLELDRLVFVVYQKTLDEYNQNNLNHPVVEVLRNVYKEIEEFYIGDIVVYKFEEKR
jgi:4-amino-4-deoxy-L-arabinose transferase-like glycosyltransferase